MNVATKNLISNVTLNEYYWIKSHIRIRNFHFPVDILTILLVCTLFYRELFVGVLVTLDELQ